MKSCPFCAEEIQDGASKCRFCNEDLASDNAKWRAYRQQFEKLSPEQQAKAMDSLTDQQKSYLTDSYKARISDMHNGSTVQRRNVGLLLGIGILFIPYIFSWFTLRKGHSLTARVISFIWLCIVMVSFSATHNNEPTNSLSSATASQASNQTQTNLGSSIASEPPKETALHQLRLEYEWGKEGFDSVMIANFTIRNPSAFSVKDLEIKCVHYANSGTMIDSNTRTIYEVIPANGSKIINKFNMGLIHNQATKSSCEVTDLQIVR